MSRITHPLDEPLGFEDPSLLDDTEMSEVLESALYALTFHQEELGEHLDLNTAYLETLRARLEKNLNLD
jgi:hypothetical protein